MPDWPTCACSYGKISSRLGRISTKSSEISLRRTGSLLIWTHLYFYKSFLRKVRSHLGELARLIACLDEMIFIPHSYEIFWHSPKSGPETRNLGLWDSQTKDPGTLRLRTQDMGFWDPDTRDPGTGTLGHETLAQKTLEMGAWDLGLATLRPRILSLGPWELNLWHRFLVSRPAPQIELTLNCEANFDSKTLGHLSRKLKCSKRWTKTFTKIFWHLS